ncbi:MAG: hypothetical protein ACI4WH_01860 [Oscillospiraceae bacterium]
MNNKTFNKLVIIALILGVISSIGMFCYTFYRYNHCSIITYIGNEDNHG